MNFKDKVAVVTGAGGTICSEIAVQLAKMGAKTVLVGRTEEKLRVVDQRIKQESGISMVCPCDVTDRDAVVKLTESVENEFGLCSFLINGAGGNNIKAMPDVEKYSPLKHDSAERTLNDISMEAFRDVLDINIMGTVIPTVEFALQMIRGGGGSIINFASMNSYCPLTRCFAYAMSKAAVVNLTQSFAAYYASANIRINAIAPGFMVNERSRNYLGTSEDGLTERGMKVIGHTPMGRFGQAEDIIGCAVWLLDDAASSFVTGITVPVDGGFLTLGGV